MKPDRIVHSFFCSVCWGPLVLSPPDFLEPTCTKYGDAHEGFVSKSFVRYARERAMTDYNEVHLLYAQSQFAHWFGLPRRKTGAELQEALERNKKLLGRSDTLF